ncbi:hypothetical protein VH22019_00093 [Vibrio phage VH2_2019]|nr:hypothetical protein VH22019_00093 [Vibrio phage VH2_2019]QWS69921.1 hypothetical protein [Vibrio phage vB_VpS_PG28]
MTVLKLGDITLDPNMTVPQLHTVDSVAQSNVPTTGGGVIVFQRAIKAGVSLQLIATDSQGWVSKDARESLLTEAAKLGGIYTLQAGNLNVRVMFDHSDGSAVELEPLINRLIPLEGDYFIGTINLITV